MNNTKTSQRKIMEKKQCISVVLSFGLGRCLNIDLKTSQTLF